MYIVHLVDQASGRLVWMGWGVRSTDAYQCCGLAEDGGEEQLRVLEALGQEADDDGVVQHRQPGVYVCAHMCLD